MFCHECPLCHGMGDPFWKDQRRDYFRCQICHLIFVPSVHWISIEQEKSIYDLHDNQIEDLGYRGFLSRLFQPMNDLIIENSNGLDFGCGPGPALAAMFEEAGHNVSLYDIFYFPDESVYQKRFQFITASEVIEHLRQPRNELWRLWELLEVDGFLGIMTKKALDLDAFKNWHYKNDMTHISFFSDATFEFLASALGGKIIFSAPDVTILQKINSSL